MIFRPGPHLSSVNRATPLYDKNTFASLVKLSIACFFYGISVGINLANFAIFLGSFNLKSSEITYILSLEIIGNVTMAPFVPMLTKALGAPKLMQVSLIFRNLFLIFFAISESYEGWTISIIGFGLFGFSLYTAIFQYVNVISMNQYRGTYLSIASVLFGLGISLGPILSSFVEIETSNNFIASALIASIMIIPLSLLPKSSDKLYSLGTVNLRKLIQFSHIPIMCALVGEFTFYSMHEFLPIYTIETDKTQSEALMLISYFSLSGLILGIPIGMMIDKFERIKMVMIFTLGMSVLIQLVPLVMHDTLLTFLVFSPLSACMNGIVICGLVIIGDKFSGNSFVAANSMIQAIGMIGAYAGIRCTGSTIELVGPEGLIYSVASVSLACFGMLLIERYMMQITANPNILDAK